MIVNETSECRAQAMPYRRCVIQPLAAKVYNDLAERLRAGGEKVTTVGAETVRGWCVREGELRELFDENRKQGRPDGWRHAIAGYGRADHVAGARTAPQEQ